MSAESARLVACGIVGGECARIPPVSIEATVTIEGGCPSHLEQAAGSIENRGDDHELRLRDMRLRGADGRVAVGLA